MEPVTKNPEHFDFPQKISEIKAYYAEIEQEFNQIRFEPYTRIPNFDNLRQVI